MSTPDYVPNFAVKRRPFMDKLPVDHAQAVGMIENFVAPLLERAGLTVKVTKTKTTRTLKITLPAQ